MFLARLQEAPPCGVHDQRGAVVANCSDRSLYSEQFSSSDRILDTGQLDITSFFAAVVLQQLMRDETDNNNRLLRLFCSNEIVLLDQLTTRER